MIGCPRGAALVAALLAWLATPLAAKDRQEPVGLPEGDLRPTGVQDLKPHQLGADGYTERWGYQVFLDGDVQLYVNFNRANLGSFKGRVCGADLSIVGLGEKAYEVAREYPGERLSFDDETSRLQIHQGIWFEGRLPDRHRLHFETTKKDVHYLVDLDFDHIEPGRVWGDGTFHLGDDRLKLFVNIPKARVKGVVEVDEVRREVQGTAYMDHLVLTASAPRILKRGYHYIRHGTGWRTGYFVEPKSRYAAGVVGYGLISRGSGVELQKPVRMGIIEEGSEDGMRLARTLEVDMGSGEPLILERTRSRHRYSIFDDLSGLVRWVARKFAGGEVVMFRGEGRSGGEPIYYSYFVTK